MVKWSLLFTAKKEHIWTEFTGVLGKKNTAVRRRYTCSVLGHDLTNMSLAITKTEHVDCRQDRRLCKSKFFITPREVFFKNKTITSG